MDSEGDRLVNESVMKAIQGKQVQPSDRLAIAACHLAMAAKELPHALEAQNMLAALSPDGADNAIKDAMDSDVADPLPAQLLARATYQLSQAANQLPHALGAHQMLQALEPLNMGDAMPKKDLDIDEIVGLLNEAADAADEGTGPVASGEAPAQYEAHDAAPLRVASATPLTMTSLPPADGNYPDHSPERLPDEPGIQADLPPPPALPPAVLATSHSPEPTLSPAGILDIHNIDSTPFANANVHAASPSPAPVAEQAQQVQHLWQLQQQLQQVQQHVQQAQQSQVQQAQAQQQPLQHQTQQPQHSDSRQAFAAQASLHKQMQGLEQLKSQYYQHKQLQNQQLQIQQQVQALQHQLQALGVRASSFDSCQSPTGQMREGVMTPPSQGPQSHARSAPMVPPRLVAPDAKVYDRDGQVRYANDDEESLPPDPLDRERSPELPPPASIPLSPMPAAPLMHYAPLAPPVHLASPLPPQPAAACVSPVPVRSASYMRSPTGGSVDDMVSRLGQLEQDKLLLEHLVAQHRRINSLPPSAVNAQMLAAMMSQIDSLKQRLLSTACNYAAAGGDLTETAAALSAHLSSHRGVSHTPQGHIGIAL